MAAPIRVITANFIISRSGLKSIAPEERLLCGSQSKTFSDGSWPIAAVELTDVPNHIKCTARQSQPPRAA